MRSELAGHLELKFMAAAQHPLAARSSINISELPSYGFVCGLPNSEFVGLLLQTMEDIGLVGCRFVMNVTDSVAIKRAAAENVGIALSFAVGAAEEIAHGDLVVLPVNCPPMRLGIYYMRRINAPAHPIADDSPPAPTSVQPRSPTRRV